MKASWFALVLAVSVAARAEGAPKARAFEAGADLSSLPRVEAAGAVFTDGDTIADAITLLRRSGFTSVRLRLWHSPEGGDYALAPTLALAKRAKAAGMSVLLDLHYSDTWADPGHQSPPAAWAKLALPALCDSVHAYTRDVLAAFVAQGTPPEYVQLGNEIDGGLLWPAGQLGKTTATRAAVARLLHAAALGAYEGSPSTRRIIHYSRGASRDAAEEFFSLLEERGVPFEVIGLSYYPWWHGPATRLPETLRGLSERFGRDVAIVETAWPWTTSWYDDTHNVVGKLPDGSRPATIEAQQSFAAEIRAIVERVPGGRGIGAWWWEPAWVAAPGAHSPWENCALFDEKGRLLPAARAFALPPPPPPASPLPSGHPH